ncbi:MAG: hypothetical protein LH467_14155 [Gemmatimonadaceae bacterium]|nr:hypothetical protein [Gemmatimonadaceae bacterium]
MRLTFADGLFWMSVASCAFAQFCILRSVGGGRHAPTSMATLPRQRGSTEMVWAAVPALGLVLLLVFTWRAIHPRPATAGSREPVAAAMR